MTNQLVDDVAAAKRLAEIEPQIGSIIMNEAGPVVTHELLLRLVTHCETLLALTQRLADRNGQLSQLLTRYANGQQDGGAEAREAIEEPQTTTDWVEP